MSLNYYNYLRLQTYLPGKRRNRLLKVNQQIWLGITLTCTGLFFSVTTWLERGLWCVVGICAIYGWWKWRKQLLVATKELSYFNPATGIKSKCQRKKGSLIRVVEFLEITR